MVDLNDYSVEALEKALLEKREQEKKREAERRAAYENIRADLIIAVRDKVNLTVNAVHSLSEFLTSEINAFRAIMNEYGQLRDPLQMSFKIGNEDFRIWVKTNKVKRFDERADVAATRLIEFLQAWIKRAEQGENNPMYQLAMTLLERNKNGDLDYKSISKLYDLESRFNDPEYSSIMQLFKESNIIEGTATNYYFEERNENGVWKRLEPSFNRL